MFITAKPGAPSNKARWTMMWLLIGVMAYGLAGLAFHFPSGFPPNNGDNFNLPALFVGAIQGAFSGLVIGSLQALLLRQYFQGIRWWIAASAVGLAITHAIGDALPDPVALPVVQIIGGILLGVGQWLVLRNQGANTVVWIIAIGIAWFAGLALGLTIMQPVASDWQTQHVVAALTTGLAVSIATGALFMGLAGQLPHQPH